MLDKIHRITFHALNSLGIRNGASHTELKIADDGTIKLIEIGGRMGGDCIGSDLVPLSTGVDFVRAVVDVAVGREPMLQRSEKSPVSGIRFIFRSADIEPLMRMKREHPDYLIREDVRPVTDSAVSDSAARFGYYLFTAKEPTALLPYLPEETD